MAMATRLLLILALLIQQLALPVVATAAPSEDCLATSCCEVISTITCCGEVINEMRCGKTGGECLCGVAPDNGEPAPPAPRPHERTELGPLFVNVLSDVIDLPPVLPTLPSATLQVRLRNHNETHALLCIWRT